MSTFPYNLNFVSEIVKEYDYWEHICGARFSFKTSNFNSSIFDTINENYEKYVFTSSAQFTNITNREYPRGMFAHGWKYFLGKIFIYY